MSVEESWIFILIITLHKWLLSPAVSRLFMRAFIEPSARVWQSARFDPCKVSSFLGRTGRTIRICAWLNAAMQRVGSFSVGARQGCPCGGYAGWTCAPLWSYTTPLCVRLQLVSNANAPSRWATFTRGVGALYPVLIQKVYPRDRCFTIRRDITAMSWKKPYSVVDLALRR